MVVALQGDIGLKLYEGWPVEGNFFTFRESIIASMSEYQEEIINIVYVERVIALCVIYKRGINVHIVRNGYIIGHA